jgi:FAD:protein FMN transferase
MFTVINDQSPESVTLSLLRVSRRAMATRFEIALPLGTPDALAAAEDALDLIDTLEDQLTVYRGHSAISRVNSEAFEQGVEVDEPLFEFLRRALVLHRATGGAFDIATGALIDAWGFRTRTPAVPDSKAFVAAMHASGSRHVVLDESRRTVRFKRPGLALNLGSIGKGYALDQAATRLSHNWGITSALLTGGGSSVRTLGTPPDDPRGWRVALRHPANDGRTLGQVRLRNNALATSAATFQFFTYKERRLGHVLDPRSGWPADGVASATVIAACAADADALSTAFFVMGLPRSEEYLLSRPDLAAVILPEDADTPARLGDLDWQPPSLHEAALNDLTLPD